MKTTRITFLFALAASAALAQVTVSSVTNAAGYVPQTLPGGGITQGAMMVIKGSNLGPRDVLVAPSFPLQTTFGGTSVSVTVGGRTVAGIMYYTLATQVAAILPSSTPVGTGTLTVTYNGQTSAPAPIIVVANNFNMFTINQGGSGDAIAFLNSDNGLITPVHSANPGDTVVLWGTGLGPVSGDETRPAVQADLTSVPIEVFVGGKSASVLFRGRNGCCSSVDTVYFAVPAGVSGCVVPVITKIGNVVGNGGSISVSPSGRVCPPTTPGTGGLDFNSILSKGAVNYGGVTLNRNVSTTAAITVGDFTLPGTVTRLDTGGGTFFRVTVPPGGAGASALVDVANFGACTVSFFTSANPPSTPFSVTSLDAGPSLSLTGPGGPKTIAKLASGSLSIYSSTLDQSGNYLSAGSYTTTGPGGADIGPFSVTISLPQPLVWTNQASITTVNRASGQTVTWSGGDPAGYVQIQGFSFVGSSAANSVIGLFTCTAKTSDGSFNIPSYVLLALPPSGTISQDGVSIALPGSLSVGSFTTTVPFTARGLDFAGITGSVTNSTQVTYK